VATQTVFKTSGGQSATALTAVAGIDTWIFDLDDTLYPRSSGLHERMVMSIISLIQQRVGLDSDQARALHLRYYELYGTSMIGLSRHHGISPQCFLDSMHHVDISCIGEGAPLRRYLAALPGRRIVFTNGSRRHAERILDHLGLADLFSEICDIEACDFVGKPGRKAYDTLLARQRVDPTRAAIFDDRSVNLKIPFTLGMKTILVDPVRRDADEAHINAVTTDLAFFFSSMLSDTPMRSSHHHDHADRNQSLIDGAVTTCATNL
jgi:putative hydrolase of the HAD superfamily